MLAHKARISVLGLALLLAWPPLHFRLVERIDLNPWKFFGFAMYCCPTLPVQLDIDVVEQGRIVRLGVGELPPPLRAACRRFALDRSVLGTLRDARPLALRILRSRPMAEAVRIDVRHPHIDRATGSIVETHYRSEYRREEAVPRGLTLADGPAGPPWAGG